MRFGSASNPASCFVVAMLLLGLARIPLAQSAHNIFALGDLRAFSCAARVAHAGNDPYRAEPLGACERGLVGLTGTNFVIPAPLPGHALAAFAAFAELPFERLALAWCVLLALVYATTSAALAKLAKLPAALVAVACFPLAFAIPIDQGQLVPLAVALVVAATVALRRGHDGMAALLTAVSTIEPHLGLPACIALFAARPRARGPLAATALVCGAAAVATIGWANTGEYVARVLPAHIAAEARYDDQYSLTYLLTWLHVPLTPALAGGEFSYWLMTLAGAGAAVTLARRTGDSRYLLFVPLAASVVGGPYVHQEHLLAALPLALVVLATAGRRSVSAAVALALIACPLKFALDTFHAFGFPLHLATAAVTVPGEPPPLLAQTVWAAGIANDGGHWTAFAVKLPTWIGLALLVAVVSARLGFSPPRRLGRRDPAAAPPASAGSEMPFERA